MRRYNAGYPIVDRINPIFFWHKCNFCNIEFKKELGFKIEDYKACHGIVEDPIRTYYCCSKCAKDELEVLRLIRERKQRFLNNKPPIPGAPPKPKMQELRRGL